MSGLQYITAPDPQAGRILGDIGRRLRERYLRKRGPVYIPARKVELRGAVAELKRLIEDPPRPVLEVMIDGPARTGKTFGILSIVDNLARQYPELRILLSRKVFSDIEDSVVDTLWNKVLEGNGELMGIRKSGGKATDRIEYPNGSVFITGGLDRPGKHLSREYDIIIINQAEETFKQDLETLTTRATGTAGNLRRATGGRLMALVIVDANPGPPRHYLLQRCKPPASPEDPPAPMLRLQSKHEDNPLLHDGTDWTAVGRATINVLKALTGTRLLRLFRGLWVQAEGAVYPGFLWETHMLPRNSKRHGLTGDPDNPIPAHWRRIRVIDFGYTNPFVCSWYAFDGDGRAYRYREIYHTRRTVTVHADEIKRVEAGVPADKWALLSKQAKDKAWRESGELISATICDHDAGDRADLEEAGIITSPAYKSIRRGINNVEERLKVQPDGSPRLFFLMGSLVEKDPLLLEKELPLCTEQEFEVYLYPDTPISRNERELPVDKNNHGMDVTRYALADADELTDEATGDAGFYFG